MGDRETRREDGAVEQGREKTHTTRRTLYLPALIVAAVLVACAVALLAFEQKAEAAFPGKNGGMAYNGDGVIYTVDPGGGARAKVTRGYQPSSPGGNGIARTVLGGSHAREALAETSGPVAGRDPPTEPARSSS